MKQDTPSPWSCDGQGYDDDLLDLNDMIRDDPREALFNDYRDRVRDAAPTLQMIKTLGLLPANLGSQDWWSNFVRVVANQALQDLSHRDTHPQ